MSPNRKLSIIIAAAIAVAFASVFLLTAILGPSDNGIRCSRSSDRAVCEVLQTRFFGLFGNSAFTIPESTIRGARIVCAARTTGRSGPNCNVDLILDSGPYRDYPVVSYAIQGQAEASAAQLNAYFKDKSANSIEIKEDLLTPIVLFALLPVALIALVIALRPQPHHAGNGFPRA